jgi:hypothetical protein
MKKVGIMRCRTAAMVLDAELLATEPWRKRLMVKLHLALCPQCRTFEDQLQQLRAAAQALRTSIDAEASASTLEERLARKLGLTNPVPSSAAPLSRNIRRVLEGKHPAG